MKKHLYQFTVSISLLINTSGAVAQNVGVGTVIPLARFHVKDSSVLFSAPLSLPLNLGPTPVNGAGTRFMWYAQKGALRAGSVSDNSWDRDSIGLRSVSFGNSTRAIGENSFASGNSTIARGFVSTAMGEYTNATGYIATAIGAQTNATNEFCFASGFQSSATGSTSTAMGYKVIASGSNSTAIGASTTASGAISVALGSDCIASGDFSIAAGYQCHAKAMGGAVFGMSNDDADNPNDSPTDRIFQIGNGNFFSRSNAITILRNGKTGIGVTDPQQTLSLKGGMNIDQTDQNTGSFDNNVMRFGSFSGEAIGSGRIVGSDNRWGLDFYTASIKRMVITNLGNVGIGTSTPSDKLQVIGAVRADVFLTPSDASLKTNMRPITTSLNTLLQLNAYRFHWKDEKKDTSTQIGLIAQEVQKQFPELVKENAAGELSVNYSGMIPLLLNAIKEQQKQIQAQENEHIKQQQAIDELRMEIKKMREQKKPGYL
jgi:endosialidase-like protein/trimeric autotransporter adhesin